MQQSSNQVSPLLESCLFFYAVVDNEKQLNSTGMMGMKGEDNKRKAQLLLYCDIFYNYLIAIGVIGDSIGHLDMLPVHGEANTVTHKTQSFTNTHPLMF